MAGNVVLASAMFLVTVTGLLSPPPPPRAFASRGGGGRRHRTTSASRNTPRNLFDADAWKDIEAVAANVGSEFATPPVGPITASPQDEEPRVDVDKLPTFAFFTGDRGRRREDIVGGIDTGSCRARLEAKLASLWGTEKPVSRPPDKRCGPEQGNVMDGAQTAVDGGNGGNSDCRDMTSITSMSMDVNMSSINCNPNIVVDVASRDGLRRIINDRREGQGPVVVMYHAPWCRKCAYLTPTFRRLAQQTVDKVASAGHCNSNIDTRRDGPVFCRVDTSTWRGRFVAAGGGGGGGDGEAAARGNDGAVAMAGVTAEIKRSRKRKRGRHGSVLRTGSREEGAGAAEMLHDGSPAMGDCDVCGRSGFVPCGECEGKGAVARSSLDGKHTLAVTCPACVGYKRLRCPSCGGKCYMCE